MFICIQMMMFEGTCKVLKTPSTHYYCISLYIYVYRTFLNSCLIYLLFLLCVHCNYFCISRKSVLTCMGLFFLRVQFNSFQKGETPVFFKNHAAANGVIVTWPGWYIQIDFCFKRRRRRHLCIKIVDIFTELSDILRILTGFGEIFLEQLKRCI